MDLFWVGVKGVVVSNDKLLILRTNPDENRGERWEFPGGRIDRDETMHQALIRELQEELPGISNIEIGDLLHAFRLPRELPEHNGLALVFYKVTADFPDDITVSSEHLESRWVSKTEAIELVPQNLHEVIVSL